MLTPIIAGNWKMNITIAEAEELVKALHYGLANPGSVEVVVAPSFVALDRVATLLRDSFIAVAGQDLFWQDSGAYTGQISGGMLKDVGASYVIIGHSERRQYFGETDATVNQKIKAAFKHGLTPIICVGETLEQREAGQVEAIITTQLREGLQGITGAELSQAVIAYEPVWAIGTGKTASPEQAEEVHSMIRNLLTADFGTDVADKVRLLYGGSVKPANSKELMSKPNIDGALVGGASLKADDFLGIITSI